MSNEQLYLAFDFGERRTGVALGQSITGTARPLTTLMSSSTSEPNWDDIQLLINEWHPTKLIVGIPGDDPANAKLRKKILVFCENLRDKFNATVELHDETLSSDEAYHQLKNRRRQVKGKIQKLDIDQYAAAILLESWMSTNLSK